MLDYLFYFLAPLYGPLLVLTGLGLAVFPFLLLARANKPLLEDTIAHWHATLEGVSMSTSDFYEAVEHRIQDWQLVDVNARRISLTEGGALSCKRTYLRVRRQGLLYDIFAAPFGGGFFVTTWMVLPISPGLKILVGVPLLGRLVAWIARATSPRTYFRVDSAVLFQEITHAAVLSVIDQLTTLEGARPLTELERKPVMRELYPGASPQPPQHPAFS